MRYINYSLQLKCKYQITEGKSKQRPGLHVWIKLSIYCSCSCSCSGVPSRQCQLQQHSLRGQLFSFLLSRKVTRMIYSQELRFLYASQRLFVAKTKVDTLLMLINLRRLAAIKATTCPQGHGPARPVHTAALSLYFTLVICLQRLACEIPTAAAAKNNSCVRCLRPGRQQCQNYTEFMSRRFMMLNRVLKQDQRGQFPYVEARALPPLVTQK